MPIASGDKVQGAEYRDTEACRSPARLPPDEWQHIVLCAFRYYPSSRAYVIVGYRIRTVVPYGNLSSRLRSVNYRFIVVIEEVYC